MPSDAPLEVRQEWARLRAIMYEPSSVWLATEHSGDRWLTDQYVMLKVTRSLALGYDAPEAEDLSDGGYKLTASSGLQPRDTVPEPDLEVYFARLADLTVWVPVLPTEWSVAEHPGKAMLWRWDITPCLLGESTWTAIRRHYPGVSVDYSTYGNLFRFSGLPADCMGCAGELDVYCGHRPLPFAYAAGIHFPDGQVLAAGAVCRVLNTTSTQEGEAA